MAQIETEVLFGDLYTQYLWKPLACVSRKRASLHGVSVGRYDRIKKNEQLCEYEDDFFN